MSLSSPLLLSQPVHQYSTVLYTICWFDGTNTDWQQQKCCNDTQQGAASPNTRSHSTLQQTRVWKGGYELVLDSWLRNFVTQPLQLCPDESRDKVHIVVGKQLPVANLSWHENSSSTLSSSQLSSQSCLSPGSSPVSSQSSCDNVSLSKGLRSPN